MGGHDKATPQDQGMCLEEGRPGGKVLAFPVLLPLGTGPSALGPSDLALILSLLTAV